MKDENVTIRSLKHGKDIKFLFRVYFDRVTEDELKKIICILNVGKNKDEKTGMHKLGMGKPLGMGSIKITVDSVKIRNIKCKDDKISYSLDEYESNKNYEYNFSDIFGNNNSVKEYLKISNLIDSNYPIVYPLGENPDGGLRNTTASHQWFTGNKQIKEFGGSGTSPKIKNVLPDTMEEDVSLPRMIKK